MLRLDCLISLLISCDKHSLLCNSCPGTHYCRSAGVEFNTDLPVSPFLALGLKMFATVQ